MDFEIGPHTILLTVAGSRAYGIHRDTSDVDVKGVAIPPKRYFLGFAQKFEQVDDGARLSFALPLLNAEETRAVADTKLEGAIYELRKFMALAAENNPNILDVLFCRDAEVRLATPLGEKLRENRHLFVSARAKHTYSGYATAQLKRIKGHRKWLLDPPKGKPTRAEYGLPEHTLIPSDQLAAASAAVQKKIDRWEMDFSGVEPATVVEIQGRLAEELAEIRTAAGLGTVDELKWLTAARLVGLDENLVSIMLREREYESAARHWRQYEDWKKARNADRAALEADHGYDCYLDDTEFLTEAGWLTYDDIGPGTRLATFERVTGAIVYQHFTERVARAFEGPVGFLHPRHSSCAVTLNHRMLVSPAHRSASNGFSAAYDPSTSDWTIRSLGSLLADGRSYFHVRLAGDCPSADYPVDDDHLRLMGAYVSEGCVGKRLSDGTPSVLRISQREGGRLQDVMDGLMQRMSGIRRFRQIHAEAARAVPCPEIIWTVADRALASRMVEECGSRSFEKRLPAWVRDLSRRQADVLLEALCRGDGHQRKHSRTYYTGSKRLADDIQAMCVHVGIVSQVWGPYPDLRRPPGAMYHVYLGEGPIIGCVKLGGSKTSNFEIREVKGRIVCFTVPNEVLVTRRHGKVAIHGNTKHAAHLVRLLRMGREILETGEVHVWRGDRDGDELRAIRAGAWGYDRLVAWAESEDRALQEVYEKRAYVVPKQPDRVALDRLCVELVEAFLAG